jgi:hypothetical protein
MSLFFFKPGDFSQTSPKFVFQDKVMLGDNAVIDWSRNATLRHPVGSSRLAFVAREVHLFHPGDWGWWWMA